MTFIQGMNIKKRDFLLRYSLADLKITLKITDQTILAIRFISTHVTFYKANIPVAYWNELRMDLPQEQLVNILRWPGNKSDPELGLDLTEPTERESVLTTLAKIRKSLQ